VGATPKDYFTQIYLSHSQHTQKKMNLNKPVKERECEKALKGFQNPSTTTTTTKMMMPMSEHLFELQQGMICLCI
jgi:hypothetical protein